ncbi:DUF5994 family protein [Mycobacterium sp. shizuoka-1]|uniref:DUF5994 family protein n=1 Tax=Mycobacterium sp. shizuoka-1 TaxID=2039281 RepID=UPI000C0623EF|nr:DUF5994 family protein [Mycobacterium sp. shizuoka-1]GAY17126.1 hypothetical protein MSZK_38520 [Mycobacterium sp. shizuoka-1]
MTPTSTRSGSGWKQPAPNETPRLRLKPKAPTTGEVDGAWWPHSDDLVAEVPDLLAVLSVRLGPIVNVLYNLSEWAAAPAKVSLDGHRVRLSGYRTQPPHTVEVQGLQGAGVVLLVIPPGGDPESSHTAMMLAASPSGTTSVGELLAPAPTL